MSPDMRLVIECRLCSTALLWDSSPSSVFLGRPNIDSLRHCSLSRGRISFTMHCKNRSACCTHMSTRGDGNTTGDFNSDIEVAFMRAR